MLPIQPDDVHSTTGSSERATWRVSKWGRISASALMIPFATFFTFVGVVSDAPGMAIAFATLTPLGLWRCAFAPRIDADGRALRVVNPLSSFTIAYADVESLSSGYGGIEISPKRGRKRVAWAVQQSNFALILRLPNRSDRVVEEIRRLLHDS